MDLDRNLDIARRARLGAHRKGVPDDRVGWKPVQGQRQAGDFEDGLIGEIGEQKADICACVCVLERPGRAAAEEIPGDREAGGCRCGARREMDGKRVAVGVGRRDKAGDRGGAHEDNGALRFRGHPVVTVYD
jgi:hypothetical protein